MFKTVHQAHKHRLFIERLHAHFTLVSLLSLGVFSALSLYVAVRPPFGADAAVTTLTAMSVQTPAAEDSGLVASRQYPGVFWWMRDGGPATAAKPRDAIYAVKFDANGTPVAVRGSDKFPFNLVTGSTNNNWEDIALDDSNNIWIGDIGANDCSRNNQKLLKVKEPNPTSSETLSILASYTFKFPDAASGCNTWNSEAMFWYNNKMYIFAKTSNSPFYRVDLPSGTSGTATLVRLGTVTGGVSNISASSLSDDHSRLMLEAHEKMWIYTTTNTSLTGDALIKDLVSRSPKYSSTFNCACDTSASVEGGSFKRSSYDVAFVSEGKQIYYAKPAAYGDSGTAPNPNPPPPTGDTTPPAVSITGLAAGATVNSTMTINVTATDNVAVTKVDIFYDGTNIIRHGTSQGTYGWGSRWDTSVVPDGTHTINVTAYDAANNSKSTQVSVNVDNVTSPPPAPVISSFTANPATLTAGNKTTFSWQSTNTTDCSVAPNGPTNTTATSWQTLTLSKVGQTTYTLTCRNSAGTTTNHSTVVTVNAAPTPPSQVVLSSNVTSVQSGGSVQLSWTSNGSTGCTLNPGNFTANGTGSAKTISNLTATTSYKVTCSNNAGSTDSNTVTVTVTATPQPAAAPVIVSFAPNVDVIASGSTATLMWTTTNVVQSGCALAPSPLSSTNANSQWTTPVLTQSMTYTLTCKNKDGKSVSKYASVSVDNKPAPTPPPAVEPVVDTDTETTDNTGTVTATTGESVQNVQAKDQVTDGDLVTLDASNVTDEAKVDQIEKVEFYNGDELIATVLEAPYALDTTVLGAGTYNITQRTYFTDGSSSDQAQIITIDPSEVTTVESTSDKSKLNAKIAFSVAALLGVGLASAILLKYFLRHSKKLIATNSGQLPLDAAPRPRILPIIHDDPIEPGSVIYPNKPKDE